MPALRAWPRITCLMSTRWRMLECEVKSPGEATCEPPRELPCISTDGLLFHHRIAPVSDRFALMGPEIRLPRAIQTVSSVRRRLSECARATRASGPIGDSDADAALRERTRAPHGHRPACSGACFCAPQLRHEPVAGNSDGPEGVFSIHPGSWPSKQCESQRRR